MTCNFESVFSIKIVTFNKSSFKNDNSWWKMLHAYIGIQNSLLQKINWRSKFSLILRFQFSFDLWNNLLWKELDFRVFSFFSSILILWFPFLTTSSFLLLFWGILHSYFNLMMEFLIFQSSFLHAHWSRIPLKIRRPHNFMKRVLKRISNVRMNLNEFLEVIESH